MNGFIRKCLISMFVMMLILAGTTFLSTKNNEVQAVDASEYTTEPYTHEQIQAYKTDNAKPIKAGGDWIFAGWFTDTTCTTAYNVNTHTQEGYAKFVPADVLSVKCQVNEGLQQGDDYTNLRIVSTVDNLKYSQVGFDISIGDKDYPYVSKNVASKIEARESGVEYGYSPNIFDLDSSHFITVTITDIPQSAFDDEIRVNPYWVTKDGTKVYGVSRYLKISDSYNNIINVPVRYYSGLVEAAEAITVTYPGDMVYSEMIKGDAFDSVAVTGADGTLTLTPSGNSLVADGVYGYLRFSLATDVTLDNLPTTNNFTVTKGTETSIITYKNYLTKYNGSNADTSWYDDDKDEFVIVSQTELYGLSELSNKSGKSFSGDKIYLGGDIVANTGDVKGGTATDAKPWTPIGPRTCWFAGTLDGQGHSISGIYYSRDNQTNAGLFSRVSGTVQNLSLINSRFVSTGNGGNLGSVVAYLEGDIYNVSSDAYIQGKDNLGGIVGCIGDQSTVSATSEMINCMFTGTISSTGMHVGGMVGKVQGASSTVTAEVIIKNCLNSGTLTTTCAGNTSHARVGGMVGCVNDTNCSLDISYSMNTGELSQTSTGKGQNVYSMVGYKAGNVVEIDAQSTYSTNQTFTESGSGLHAGNMHDKGEFTGLLAYKTVDSEFFNDSEKAGLNDGVWVARYNDTPALRYFTDSYLYEPDQNALTDTKEETINDVTYTVYTIRDIADLYAIAMESLSNTFDNCIIRLDADITINTSNSSIWETKAPRYQWNPIGTINTTTNNFNGIFEGNGHTISGLYVDAVYNMAGLFGRTNSSSKIIDLNMENSYIHSSKNYAGSIVGYNSGKIENINSTAIVSAGQYVGGIAGCNKGSISKLYSNTTISSTSHYVGGITGEAASNQTISECWFDGSINANGEAVGGIVGLKQNTYALTLENCLNTGSVVGTQRVGGMLGHSSSKGSVHLEDCLNMATVTGTNSGHLVGRITGETTFTADAVYGVDVSGTLNACGQSWSAANEVNNNVFKKKTTAQLTGLLANKNTTLQFDNLDTEEENDGAWIARKNDTPALRHFVNKGLYVPDTTVLENTTTETIEGTTYTVYTVKDAGDLYAISMHSMENNFANSIIRLENDIVINTGNAKNWKTDAPEYQWNSIGANGSSTKDFAGIFDGNMKTISGVYLVEDANNRGLIASISATSIVQNVCLTNSYLKNSKPILGSIVGKANSGKFYNLYSDAIVESSDNNVGGILGLVNGSNYNIDMNNCWFAGSVVGQKEVGGIIGRISGTATVSNCLNTGDITSIASGTKIYLGGLFGSKGNSAGTSATVKNCLNVGQVYYPAKTGTTGYGSVMGCADATFNASATYTITQANVGVSNNALQDGITQVGSKSDITGAAAISKMPELFQYQNENEEYENYWAITSGGAPILESFEDVAKTTCMAIDLSWYDDSNNYKLSDAEDLYGFSVLSIENNFENATITLEDDIIINEGDSKTWGTTAPKHQWNPIGLVDNSSYTEFAGVFNGGGHSISGLYVNTAYNRAGLFGEVASSGQIKNLKLENGYITSTKGNVGSIAGIGAGKFYMLYSDAILDVQSGYIGGLVGRTTGDVVLENCWYAGKITNTANHKDNRGTGGLVGIVQSGSLTLLNGLNTGIIDVKAYVYDQDSSEGVNIMVAAGGLIGQLKDNVTATIGACLHVGDVQVSDVVTGGYGPLVGYSNTQHAANVYATYTTEAGLNTNVSRSLFTLIENAETIKGNGAKDVMPLLGWEEDWKCVDGAYPQIIFSDTGYGEDYVGNDEMAEVLALKSLYVNKTLYQGELHDHADNGKTSDGKKTLSQWADQMEGLELDFAASLDHRMVTHIDDTTNWKKNLFVYGTEAGTEITYQNGRTAEVHYNMLFKDKNSLVGVLEKFGGFNYGNAQTFPSYALSTYGDFDYPNFSSENFSTLIQEVKKAKGFFVLPHPAQNENYEGDVSDYMFKDSEGNLLQYGFEVIYQSYDHGSTVHNYNAWTELLTKGARLWATAGTDKHADLDNKALTSVYADRSADADKGNIIPYLAKGNFVAGSVGIQMSVGNTAMGGSCDFTGQKLVVDVGELHSSVFISGNKYRVDVFNENGRIYSQMISVDADTRIATNGKIVMPTKEYDFYRVEIYDVTAGKRIAIGNPIWNDK